MPLASPFKTFQLPITCDTLILTFSPHHQVLHRHSHNPEQLYSFLQPYQQTHKIVIIASTYEEGQQISAGIQDTKRKMSQTIFFEEERVGREETEFQKLMRTVQLEREKRNSWVQFKSFIDKTKENIENVDKIAASFSLINQTKTSKLSKKNRKDLKIQQKIKKGELTRKMDYELYSEPKQGKQWKQLLKNQDLALLQQLQEDQQLLQDEPNSPKENLLLQ